MNSSASTTSYVPPEVIEYPGKWLVAVRGTADGEIFLFFDRVEIGRYNEKKRLAGHLQVKDQTVSSRHCVITQEPDGRCFIRDTSRNGTRVDGRRLSPNLQTEITVGQVISIGRALELRLDGQPPTEDDPADTMTDTFGIGETTPVTVLVGDIRNYTNMVRLAGSTELQESVNRVFRRLEQEVVELGGTLKEFQGDALFAFWDKTANSNHAMDACWAALRLKDLVGRLAADPEIWSVGGYPLGMDFALATGLVTISGYGSDGAMGLSMVGESVVLAFRIEKFANNSTGPIICCPITKQLAEGSYVFKDLGKHQAKGFDVPHNLYSLVRAK